MYYDLNKKKYIESDTNKSLFFLYNTFLGRMLLKIAITKPISNIYALYMNSRLSKRKIKKFISDNNIDMDEYISKEYDSFNDFFIRKIKKDRRTIDNGLIAVCDSKLLVYKIDDNLKLNIKNSVYSIKDLIGDDRKYKYALVFRLCVDDYHHYVFPDDGVVVEKKYIKGKFHTVQPIAQERYKIFHENSREVTFLKCDNLGDVCYIEVGALLVGKIVNETVKKFKKGSEKGHFEFGGSTVILLINKEIDINNKIIENSKKEIETIVKLGQNIGK